jgi:hypothetical protein
MMRTQDVLEDLQKQSNGNAIVVNNAEEALRLGMPVAVYVNAIRELYRSGALTILIEPMGSFYLNVSGLSDNN